MSPTPLDVFACGLQGKQLIEASAGTGKTWAICGLYLRLLLERGLEVQQILVVTFTNAAAAELRERIRERIVRVLAALRGRGAPAGDPFVERLLASLRETHGLADDRMKDCLEQALQKFDEASIFTIHGFCKRALDDAPFAAGMPLAQELITDDAELRREVVNDFWRHRVAGPALAPAIAAHLVDSKFSPMRLDALLKRQVSKPLSRIVWPDLAGEIPVLDTTPLQRAHVQAQALWSQHREEIVACVLEAMPRLNKKIYNAASVYVAAESYDKLFRADDALLAPTRMEKLDLFAANRLKPNKGQAPCEAHPFFEAATSLLNEREALDDVLEQARMLLVRGLVEEGPQRLRQLKRERRVVAFDDLLFNLYDRLTSGDCPWLAGTLRERFPAALIDEFQDTDPLQFAVFDTVYSAVQSLLFMVGDPKQAIYSFRNADLHTYLRARKQAQAEYTLVHNQRSTPELLHGLNALFGANPHAFMLPGLGYHPVEAGEKPRKVLDDRSEPRSPLQLWTLPEGEPLAKADARWVAAQACAGEIARLLRSSQAGEVTLDGRPFAAGDMAVLVRSHAHGTQMRQALATLGIGSVELSQASIFASTDAQELERVLVAILEPSREPLLRAALATVLLGHDALAIEALASDEAGMLDVIARFSQYRTTWLARGVAPMLRELTLREGISERMLAQPEGQRRLTNLRHLGECLHEAAREHATPQALLRWLQVKRSEDDTTEQSQLRLDSDRNLVQIITIHKSKGLEFPVVFCPFLWDGHGGVAGRVEGREYHDDDGHPVIDFRNGNDTEAIKQRMAMERAAESLRLVYVALTRAVHRCYIVIGRYAAGPRQSLSESNKAVLNWLAAGQGVDAAAWIGQGGNPSAIAQAWVALARSHPASIGLAPLPMDPPRPVDLPRTPPAAITARTPPRHIPPGWLIGSYSSLVHGARWDAGAADHDMRAVTVGLPAARSPVQLDEDDILRFPRGARAGECIHAVFENADFMDASTWPRAVDLALRSHPMEGGGDSHARRLLRMLGDVLGTPLLPGLRLDAVPRNRRLVELEFSLSAPRLNASALIDALRTDGYPTATLGFGTLEGYLRGFIDMVFEHEGRFYVLDWKSNFLGATVGDYGAAAMTQCMDQQGYHLQYLLYTVALHRYLQRRLPGYHYDTHFGDAIYLFVRGVRPDWTAEDKPAGVSLHRPAARTIEHLSTLLGQVLKEAA